MDVVLKNQEPRSFIEEARDRYENAVALERVGDMPNARTGYLAAQAAAAVAEAESRIAADATIQEGCDYLERVVAWAVKRGEVPAGFPLPGGFAVAE